MRFALLAVFAPPMLSAQSPPLTPAQMKQDLDWFRANVFAVEKSYAPATRSEAERRLAALEEAIPRKSAIAFEMEIARIVALADNEELEVRFPSLQETLLQIDEHPHILFRPEPPDRT